MLARIVSQGRGAGGAVAYVTHDAPTPDEPRPQTAGRVAWSATSAALAATGVEDPADAPAAMQALIARAPELKAAAGVSARGRKLQKPFAHLVLSLPPGDHLDRAQWTATAASAMQSLGWSDHHAVLAVHTDTDSEHLHAVICKVDPKTGRSVAPRRAEILALSRWAEAHERDHGGIRIDARAERNRTRHDREDIAAGLEAAGQSQADARQEAYKATPMPPTADRCRRPGPGRPEPSDADRREWTTLYQRQAADDDADRTAQRRERCRLARRQDRRRRIRAWTPFPARPSPPRDRRAILRAQAAQAQPHLDLAGARLELAQHSSDWRISHALCVVQRRLEHTREILRGIITAADRTAQYLAQWRAKRDPDARRRAQPAPTPPTVRRQQPPRRTTPQPPRRQAESTWRQHLRTTRPAPEAPAPPEPAAGAADRAGRTSQYPRDR